MSSFPSELQTARTIARKASKLIQRRLDEDVSVRDKDEQGLVTSIDEEVSAFISEALRDRHPSHAVLSEESKDSQERMSSSRVWAVDPVDGTGNLVDYVNGVEHETNKYFGVHIGLVVDGEPRVGVVDLPVLNTAFYAARGFGSYKERYDGGETQPLPLGVGSSEVELAASIHRNPETAALSRRHGDSNRFANVFGYCITQVAAGNLQAYASYPVSEDRLGEWDVCAPQVILEEAGGVVMDFDGNNLAYNKERPVFSHGVIAAQSTEDADRIRN